MGKWADRFASLSWDSDDANSTEGRSREAPDPAAPEPDRFNGFNRFNYGGAPDPAAPEPGRINRINRIHPGKPRRTVDPDRVLTVQEAVAAARKAEVVFRAVGDTIEVDVPAGVSLPSNVQAALTQEALRVHLGIVYADQAAVDFLGRLGVQAVLVDTAEAAQDVLASLADADLVAIDIETGAPAASPRPIAVKRDGTVSARPGTSGDGDEAPAGLDPRRSAIMAMSLHAEGDKAVVLRGDGLRYVLDSGWLNSKRLVAHNAQFEHAFLQHHAGFSPDQPIECTMQAAGLLLGVWNRSLAAAAGALLGATPPKDLQTSCWSAPRLSSGQVAYAASDAVIAWLLWKRMEPELRAKSRFTAYELQRDAIPAVADMERRGMGFDRDRHAEQVAAWRDEIAALEAQIIELTGKPAPAKGAEERAWIEAVAGGLLQGWPRTPKRLLSTKAEHIARLTGVPEARPVMALRAKQQLLSTFGEKIAEFVNPVTGRIHASYSIAATKAGRFSCSGPNLQQLPNKAKEPTYRRIFTAAPGFVIVAGDWKQVELRAIAWLSGDPVMDEVFAAGGDLHAETALAMLGKTRDEVSKEELDIARSKAKAVNFGTIYGITGKGLAQTAWRDYGIDMPPAEGDRAIARFFDKYKLVKRWMETSWITSTRLGYVKIGAGRIVDRCWEKTRQLSPPQCANLPVQGIAADCMLRALKLTHERLCAAKIEGGLIASIHDELLIEVPITRMEEAKQILKAAMTEAFEMTFPGAPITGGVVDIKTGPSWGELE